jgi:hypothetical protein
MTRHPCSNAVLQGWRRRVARAGDVGPGPACAAAKDQESLRPLARGGPRRAARARRGSTTPDIMGGGVAGWRGLGLPLTM